ncbi:hypothetical protein EUTSA_v10015415mg [Eutrema salsugineum]|uniref:Ubiquitin-like protease family profile domain-containing protein n=1 Tax=Eutrema salsugineum TaxID=72664 RepID=V4LIV6_EUTSA|nr:hypothetical protein EUTSA_v10015415mg [Eutrema salsugineum]
MDGSVPISEREDNNPHTPVEVSEPQVEVEQIHRRFSKRARTVSTRYDSPFLCEKRIRSIIGQNPPVDEAERALQQRFEKAMKAFKSNVDAWDIRRPLNVGEEIVLTSKDINKMLGRQKSMPAMVMDTLCMLGRNLLREDSRKPRVDVLDSKFVSMLTKLYPRFSKADNRAAFKFSKALIERVQGVGEPDRVQLFTDADVLYLPFNLDIKHWVFLAVDVVSCKIHVIDCNANLRSDVSMCTEIRPLAEMLPYLFKEVAANEQMSQIKSTPDAGLVAYFLMLSHALFGIQGCLEFDITHIDMEAKKVAMVMTEQYL